MTNNVYYKATFSDGTVVKRITRAGRKYTHAWLCRRHNKPEHVEQYGAFEDHHGFSGSEHNARAMLRRYDWSPERRALAEVAPAVEVTRQEYKNG